MEEMAQLCMSFLAAPSLCGFYASQSAGLDWGGSKREEREARCTVMFFTCRIFLFRVSRFSQAMDNYKAPIHC